MPIPVANFSGLFYPNRFARYLMLAVGEVLGADGAEAAFAQAGLRNLLHPLPPDTLDRQFDFAILAAFSQALTDLYGGRGGRSMDLRIGREWFRQGFFAFGALAGMGDPAFQALLVSQRTRLALDALATVFTRYSDQATYVTERADSFLLTVQPSPLAWGRTSDRPVCHMLTGLIQETLNWSTQGFEFHVQEQICAAAGGEACVFIANKKPIGQLAGG